MASEHRFGYEWSHYDTLDSNYEQQFKGWIKPLDQAFFVGKRILDAGCGMGRNSYWCAKWGAQEVVAFDNDDRTIASAKKTLQNLSNVTVEKKNIYNIKYDKEFDFVFSIGVIHHLKQPELAIEKLRRALRPGGTILVWLYGYEGNELLLKFLDPLRKHITRRISPSILHFLTYFLSIPFFLYLKIVRPSGAYYKLLQSFHFLHIHSIIFDQLLPEIARYYTYQEALALFKDFIDVSVSHTNDCSWSVVGRVPFSR